VKLSDRQLSYGRSGIAQEQLDQIWINSFLSYQSRALFLNHKITQQ